MRTKIYLALLCIVGSVVAVSAQVLPPPVPPPPPPGLPIDGGVFLLMLTGLVYGVKKLKQ